jgi:hypothetical protein
MTRDRVRIAAIAAIGIGGAFSGCTCRKQEREVASIDGPVAARVVEVKRTKLTIEAVGAAHAGGIIYPATHHETTCELVVSRPKTLTLDIGPACVDHDYELVADPAGTRLALRPVDTPAAPYRLVYFGGGNRSFDASEPLDGSRPIAWSNVPLLDDALEAIFRATPVPLVFDEVRERRGEKGLADFLVRTADVEPDRERSELVCPPIGRSLWKEAFVGLSPEGKSATCSGLMASVSRPDVRPATLERTILFCDVDAPMSFPTLDVLLSRGAKEGPKALSRVAFAVLLLRRAARDAKTAAALACERLSTDPEPTLIEPDVRASLVAVAATHLSCSGVRRVVKAEASTYCRIAEWYEPSSTGHPRVLRDPATGAGHASALVQGTLDDARSFICAERIDEGEEALTVAVRALMPAARDILLPVERFTYPLEMPKSPPCSTLDPSRAGTSCTLGSTHEEEERFDCDPRTKSVVIEHHDDDAPPSMSAEGRFDDAKKVIRIVRAKESAIGEGSLQATP